MQVLNSELKSAAHTEVRPSGAPLQGKVATRGRVSYSKKPQTNEKLFLNVYSEEENPSNLELEEFEVDVHDVRAYQKEFTLEKNGFNLFKLEVPEGIDWQNKEEVEKVYYPLVEKLLKNVTEATRVHIFDHTLRNGHLRDNKDGKVEISKDVTKPNQPVGMAHVDYSADSGIDRLSAVLPNEADELRKTPFAVIQVWRPLKGPVRSSPLGMIDASTVEKADLTAYEIRFPGRIGYNLAVHHNERHKWFTAPGMTTDEAFVFCCYDSREERPGRFTPHTGFKDLSVGPDAPPRESVELRAYVFWENDAPREVKRVI